MTSPTNISALLLTPGASADRDHRTLVAIESGLPELAVVRLTLGTTSVPRAVDKIVAAVDDLVQDLQIERRNVVIGGRSFGGRACSVAAADGLDVGGLALLSYPLHPPGKPEKLRTEHFESITIPTLFVCGDRDPFGGPEEFEQHVQAIPGPVDLRFVSGPHAPSDDDSVVREVRDWLAE